MMKFGDILVYEQAYWDIAIVTSNVMTFSVCKVLVDEL